MPINPLRPAPNFNLQVIPNGAIIDEVRVNEFQKSMANLAGRGATIKTLSYTRTNGRFRIPCGVTSMGFPNSFVLSKKSLGIPLWLNTGHNRISIFFSVCLNLMFPLPFVVGGFVGSVVRIEIVRGGTAYTLKEVSWRDPSLDALGFGFFTVDAPLSSLFINSPIHCEEIYLRLHYSSVEGYDILLGQQTAGTLSNPEWWNGIGYFGAACYRDTDIC